MGRPPSVEDDELVEALQQLLEFPKKPQAWTEEVADIVGENQENVRNRLENAAENPNVPITGDRREPGSYIWWFTNPNYYSFSESPDNMNSQL